MLAPASAKSDVPSARIVSSRVVHTSGGLNWKNGGGFTWRGGRHGAPPPRGVAQLPPPPRGARGARRGPRAPPGDGTHDTDGPDASRRMPTPPLSALRPSIGRRRKRRPSAPAIGKAVAGAGPLGPRLAAPQGTYARSLASGLSAHR